MKKIKMGSFDAVDMKLYRGDNPYKEVGRTYSSASEAFKDADYATAIWRCESEHEYGWRVRVGLPFSRVLAWLISLRLRSWIG